ncbi:hypothetical protein EV426DRAFT_698933 [Tirmania nivea]|nr:hypothetical protein EV426DRAFT_698933 [Tirmania nivea]
MFLAISATRVDLIDDSDPAEIIFDSSDLYIDKGPNTDNIEYLVYNTTDNEDNNILDLSSVPTSNIDGDNSDNIKTDNKDIDNKEDYI